MAGYRNYIYFYHYSLSSQLCLSMAEYRKYISSRCIFISSFVSLTNYVGQKLNNLMWLCMAGYRNYIYILGTIIWLMSHILTAYNRPGFQWNVNTHGGRSHIYLLLLCIWIIYCIIDIHDVRAQSQVSSKGQLLFIYYIQINMSQICTFWTEIQGYHLTQLMWCTLIIFRFFSYVSIVHLLWRR